MKYIIAFALVALLAGVAQAEEARVMVSRALVTAESCPDTNPAQQSTCCNGRHCPFANGVCCGKGTSCCPSGAKCLDASFGSPQQCAAPVTVPLGCNCPKNGTESKCACGSSKDKADSASSASSSSAESKEEKPQPVAAPAPANPCDCLDKPACPCAQPAKLPFVQNIIIRYAGDNDQDSSASNAKDSGAKKEALQPTVEARKARRFRSPMRR